MRENYLVSDSLDIRTSKTLPEVVDRLEEFKGNEFSQKDVSWRIREPKSYTCILRATHKLQEPLTSLKPFDRVCKKDLLLEEKNVDGIPTQTRQCFEGTKE